MGAEAAVGFGDSAKTIGYPRPDRAAEVGVRARIAGRESDRLTEDGGMLEGARDRLHLAEPHEMRPFTEVELEAAYLRWQRANAHLADVFLVLSWTGLRWAEARSVRVDDVMEVPTPGLLIRRSSPEGVGVKSTKGRRSRRVPLADRVLPIVRQMAEGKAPDDLLLTTDGGSMLHRTAVLRSLKWETTGAGRRIHDLRHTAACLWLARGVDLTTVQSWMGHESIATTNRYVHFLGTGADVAGLELLNSDRGRAGGARTRKSPRDRDARTVDDGGVSPGQTGI